MRDLRVFAYCDARYAEATRQAAGRSCHLMTSPPIRDLDLRELAPTVKADLVYFNFHSVPGVDVWLNTQGDIALSAETLARLDLSQSVVFMVNCYAGSGLLDAIRARKPRALIGGEGENLGALNRMAGADLLGQGVRVGLQLGMTADRALNFAKLRLRIAPQTASVKDALEFKLL